MTMQLELSEGAVSRIRAQAYRQDQEPDEVVRRLIESAFPEPVKVDKVELLKWLDEFVASRPEDTPILSDYAMSRESIYDHEILKQ